MNLLPFFLLFIAAMMVGCRSTKSSASDTETVTTTAVHTLRRDSSMRVLAIEIDSPVFMIHDRYALQGSRIVKAARIRAVASEGAVSMAAADSARSEAASDHRSASADVRPAHSLPLWFTIAILAASAFVFRRFFLTLRRDGK